MKQWLAFRGLVRQHEQTIYTALCIGIVYTLVFWTLLNSILCLTMAGFWLVFTSKKVALSDRRKKLILLFASIYLLLLAGLLYTADMEEGLRLVQLKSAILLFPVIIGTTNILTPKTTRLILLHFLIATSIACVAGFVYGSIQYFKSGNPIMLTGENLLIFPDLYPYIMGLFCVLSIIIAYQLLPFYRKHIKRLLILLCAFLSLIIVLLSIRLIICCWLLIVLFLSFKKYITGIYYRIATIVLLLTLLVIAIAKVPSLQNQWRDLRDFSESNTIKLDQDSSLGQSWGGKAIRLAIWKCSKDVIRKHWLTGVGSGDIQDTLQVAYENRRFYFASKYNRYNAHNQYIQLMIGHGITGVALLILCIVLPFVWLRKQQSLETYALFLFLFSAICFSEVILDINKGIIWYSFFNSIFAFSQADNT